MLFPALVGPSYTLRSRNIDAEAAINLFVETVASAGNAKKSTLIGTPGLKYFLTIPHLRCRGFFSEDGRTFVVVGTQLWEINVDGATAVIRGSVPDDGLPVFFASNGRGGEQLAISGGGYLLIFNFVTNALVGVAIPLTHAPLTVRFLDGYFLLLEKDSIRVWYSNLENGLVWDALDFFARSQVSDNLVGMDILRGRIWLFGSKKTEVFYDSGDADNPFVPYPGSTMEEGLVSPYAEAILGEAVIWVSQDAEGHGRVVRASDYAPERISTPAIDVALATYPTVSDCEVLVYEQEGHPFAAFTFPQGGILGGEDGVTWCYDEREQAWHQRASWDEARGVFTRWRARGGVAAGQQPILVGDFATGDLYTLDLNTFQDNGVTIRRLRRTPYVSDENQWLFLDRVELGIESGVGLAAPVGLLTGPGVDPQLWLRVSRDGGHTWGASMTAAMGRMGLYLTRAIWRRLGRVRADRLVIEITQTDPVRAIWGPGAWLKATPGSGEL